MLRWRVILNDGAAVDEPAVGASIKIIDCNVRELQVINDSGATVCKFAMEPGDAPIFYRIRSAIIGQFHNPETYATVYGRARDAGNEISSTLRAFVKGQDIDCPVWAIDTSMIEYQLTG